MVQRVYNTLCLIELKTFRSPSCAECIALVFGGYEKIIIKPVPLRREGMSDSYSYSEFTTLTRYLV